MKTSQKGFISPFLLALVAALIIGGVVFVYMQGKQTNQSAVVESQFSSHELGISLNYPQGWLISTSTKSQSLIDYAAKHPEFLYTDISVYKSNYRLSIYTTTDPSQGGSSVLNKTGIPAGEVGLIIDGHQAWRDSKPDLCADIEQPQPEGLCYDISFLDEKFVPFGGYPAGSVDQIVKQNRRYIFTFYVPNVPDESVVKELDRIVESIAIQTSDWKTYANSKLGFEFQYPSSFGILNPEEYIHTSAEKLKNNPDSVVFLDGRLVMSSGVSYNGTTGQPMTFTEVTSGGSNKKQIIVDGIHGIEVSSSQIGTVISIPLSGNTIFVIEGSPDLLDQILPTFKFNP